jgi:hypothetical protein
MSWRPSARLRALGVAVAVAALLLLVGRQLGPSGCYASHSAFRAQTAAMLDGHLALTTAPEAIVHDMAWTDAGVQQVWGLGVPAWQLPFELVGRAVGVTPFPDRIPMLLWMTLLIFVVLRAWWCHRAGEPRWMAAGAIAIVVLLPAFVTLVRGRVGVYEEVAIYAYGAGVIMLAGLVHLRAAPSRARLFVLLAFAGLAGFIRPTMLAYSGATLVIASLLWLRARGRRGLPELAIGCVLFAAGPAALYGTNVARFGSGTEFGHRLNLQSLPGNIYATRFSYPMQHASIAEASLELVTGLFDRPEKHANKTFYQEGLHHGVSTRTRWREYYFTTYSWGYLPLLLAGFVIGVLAWRRRATAAAPAPTEDDPDARWLVAWAALALIPLLGFYLRSPFVSSRYQLDLAPAFAALLVIAWRAGARRLVDHARGPAIACGVLALLWSAAVITSKTASPRSANPIGRAEAARRTSAFTDAAAAPRTFPAAYDLTDPWLPTYTDLLHSFDRCGDGRCLHGERQDKSEQWTVVEKSGDAVVATHHPAPCLYLNLYRWNLDTGQMPPASFAFVDNPTFVEIEVRMIEGTSPTTLEGWAREVKVAVGLTHLRLASMTPTPRGTLLRFETSERLGTGIQVAFFAFGPEDELDNPMSRIAVSRIRWR